MRVNKTDTNNVWLFYDK